MFPLPSSDADSRAKSNEKNKKDLRPVIYVYVYVDNPSKSLVFSKHAKIVG